MSQKVNLEEMKRKKKIINENKRWDNMKNSKKNDRQNKMKIKSQSIWLENRKKNR